MDIYSDIREFYYKSWGRKLDDGPGDWNEIDLATKNQIEDDFMKYQKEYMEWEEWFYNPMSYYGVSR